MFKQLNSAFGKFFTRDKVIIIIILFILGYALMAYSGSKSLNLDGMGDGSNDSNSSSSGTPSTGSSQPSVKTTSAQNYVQPPSGMSSAGSNSYSSQSVASPSDLLPRDENSRWGELNPVGTKEGMQMPDLLPAGTHIGLDTIGQTLKNANLQLRSDPIIPKVDVGPWYNSTIEPDLGRVPLEIGVYK